MENDSSQPQSSPTASEYRVAADRVSKLADLLQRQRWGASEVARILQQTFQQSPVERPGEVRRDVAKMRQSGQTPEEFVANLRRQATMLREKAYELETR